MDTPIPIWTLLHGEELRRMYASVSGRDGQHIILSMDTRSAHVRLMVPEKALPWNHIFMFQGITLPHGLPERVKRVECSQGGRGYADPCPQIIATPHANGVKESLSDFPGAFPLRKYSRHYVEQTVYLRAYLLPKSISGLIVTFRERSLEPCYKMVETSREGLIVRTVNSYD
jgi:hypothetical protein